MPEENTYLFLCQAGAAKSLIAAEIFNELVRRHGLPLRGVAVAADEPYAAVPPPVVELLGQQSIDVAGFVPRRVTAADAEQAAGVVAIDCDLSSVRLKLPEVERWDDVPKVSEDLHGSAAAIRRRVEELVRRLASP